MKIYKQHISLFFLVFFISLKLVGLHEFTHSEEEHHNDCDICEYVIISNTTPFIVVFEQTKVKQLIQFKYTQHIFFKYEYLFIQNQIDTILFCRPPPTA